MPAPSVAAIPGIRFRTSPAFSGFSAARLIASARGKSRPRTGCQGKVLFYAATRSVLADVRRLLPADAGAIAAKSVKDKQGAACPALNTAKLSGRDKGGEKNDPLFSAADRVMDALQRPTPVASKVHRVSASGGWPRQRKPWIAPGRGFPACSAPARAAVAHPARWPARALSTDVPRNG